MATLGSSSSSGAMRLEVRRVRAGDTASCPLAMGLLDVAGSRSVVAPAWDDDPTDPGRPTEDPPLDRPVDWGGIHLRSRLTSLRLGRFSSSKNASHVSAERRFPEGKEDMFSLLGG